MPLASTGHIRFADMDSVGHCIYLWVSIWTQAVNLKVPDRRTVDCHTGDMGVASTVLDTHPPEAQSPRAFEYLLAIAGTIVHICR